MGFYSGVNWYGILCLARKLQEHLGNIFLKMRVRTESHKRVTDTGWLCRKLEQRQGCHVIVFCNCDLIDRRKSRIGSRHCVKPFWRHCHLGALHYREVDHILDVRYLWTSLAHWKGLNLQYLFCSWHPWVGWGFFALSHCKWERYCPLLLFMSSFSCWVFILLGKIVNFNGCFELLVISVL